MTLERVAARLTQLEGALREARPYVFNRTTRHDGAEDWRTQTAKVVLARVDAAIKGVVPTPAASSRPPGDSANDPVDTPCTPGGSLTTPHKEYGA